MINTIDLFSGCGGMTDGFLQEGHYKTLACVEWEKPMCITLANRLSKKWGYQDTDKTVIQFDIQRTEELFSGFNDKAYGKSDGLDAIVANRKVDMIIGGPPCQAYSVAGRIRDVDGMKNDYRNYLFESYIKVVKHYQPDYFVFENVVGLLSAAPDGSPIKHKIYQSFKDAGYRVISDFKEAMYDVADFGVPQHRKRIIILGVREKTFINDGIDNCETVLKDFYVNIFPKYRVQKWSTVRDAIGDLPKLYPVEDVIKGYKVKYSHAPIESEGYLNHTARFQNKRDIGVFKLLAEDIKSGRCEYTSTNKLKELYTKITGKESNIHKYYVLRENEPSNTIPAHLYKDGMRHIHPDPEQARSITVREAARLQSFADDFEFLGAMSFQYKMIGNAVPSLFAKKIAMALHELVNKYKLIK